MAHEKAVERARSAGETKKSKSPRLIRTSSKDVEVPTEIRLQLSARVSIQPAKKDLSSRASPFRVPRDWSTLDVNHFRRPLEPDRHAAEPLLPSDDRSSAQNIAHPKSTYIAFHPGGSQH